MGSAGGGRDAALVSFGMAFDYRRIDEADRCFLGVACEVKAPRVSVLPIRYDHTSTWMKGADRGPDALIAASREVELFDMSTESEPHLRGIETLSGIDFDGPPEELVSMVATVVGELMDLGRLPFVLGGEHSVSIGAIQAAAARSADEFATLQIDAHGDTRDSFHGSTCNHACVMARAREVGEIVQVGIRAIDRSERERMDPNRVYTAQRILEEERRADDRWMDEVVSLLPEKVYLTIDLDAFDAGIMPATGTPEPGGLDWRMVTELVRRVARDRTIVAADVVELLPHPAHWSCDFLAAKLVHRVVAEILAAD